MPQKKLLPYQEQMLQAPDLFPHIFYFLLNGGYATGKTTNLIDCLLKVVNELQGKKDTNGSNPRVILAGSTISFMEQTSLLVLEQILINTGSKYKWNKTNNIITIGNVNIIIKPCEEPEKIYGVDCYCLRENTRILTKDGYKKIKDLSIFDFVLTREGYKKVKKVKYMGKKPCLKLDFSNGKTIYSTKDHRFIAFNKEITADELAKTDRCITINNIWKQKQNIIGVMTREKNQMSSLLMGLDIIDTRKAKVQTKEITTIALQSIKEWVIQVITEIYGENITEKFQKDMMSTIRTEIHLIILLKILCYALQVNIGQFITWVGAKKEYRNNLKVLKRLTKKLKNCGKITNIEKEYLKTEKSFGKITKSIKNANIVEIFLSLIAKMQNIVLQSAEENTKTGEMEFQVYGNIILKKEFAKYVGKNIQRINTPLLKPVHLTAKTYCEDKLYPVYDVEVEDCHEFFAEDILVHNCCFWDEMDELPSEVSEKAFDRLTQRLRQNIDGMRKNFMCIYSTTQGLSGMYNTYVNMKKNKTPFMIMRARTKDNIYLPREYVRLLYSSMSKDRQRAELEGHFVSLNTYNVFSEYRKEKHLLDNDFYEKFVNDPEYANIPVYIGQDFNKDTIGNNAVAAALIKNAIVFIKDYNIGDISSAPQIFRTDFPTQPITWIPDTTDAKTIAAISPIFQSETYRINIAKGKNPPIAPRIFACNTLFHLDRMFICPVCESLERSVLLHKYDRGGKIKKGEENAPDHKTDCMAYVATYMLANRGELYDIYTMTLGRNFLFNNPKSIADIEESGKRY